MFTIKQTDVPVKWLPSLVPVPEDQINVICGVPWINVTRKLGLASDHSVDIEYWN